MSVDRPSQIRGKDFCTYYGNTPLGSAKKSDDKDFFFTVTKSRKIFQTLRWKGKVSIIKPDKNSPCLIDNTVFKTESSVRGICDRCCRYTVTEREWKVLKEAPDSNDQPKPGSVRD